MLGGVEIGDNTVGVLWILATSALWAAYIVVGRGSRRSAAASPAWASGSPSVRSRSRPSVPRAAVRSSPRAGCLVLCLLVGVLSNAIGYGIDQHVLRRIPVRRFSVLLALLPVTALLFGWIALDQRPSALDLVGIAFVLAGVALQEHDEIPNAPMPEPS